MTVLMSKGRKRWVGFDCCWSLLSPGAAEKRRGAGGNLSVPLTVVNVRSPTHHSQYGELLPLLLHALLFLIHSRLDLTYFTGG